MNAFDVAINTLFNDSNMKTAVVHIPISSDSQSKKVNVILYRPDALINVAESFVVSSALVIEVLASDCPEVSTGDKFMIQDKLYTVQGEPKLNSNNLVWRIDLS